MYVKAKKRHRLELNHAAGIQRKDAKRQRRKDPDGEWARGFTRERRGDKAMTAPIP
jgi:hypothetical protein